MMIMRKVAQAASAGLVKANDFDNFWPSPYGNGKKEIDFRSPEYKEWWNKMKKKNKSM